MTLATACMPAGPSPPASAMTVSTTAERLRAGAGVTTAAAACLGGPPIGSKLNPLPTMRSMSRPDAELAVARSQPQILRPLLRRHARLDQLLGDLLRRCALLHHLRRLADI